MTSVPALLPLNLLLPCAGGQTTGEDATFANVVGQGQVGDRKVTTSTSWDQMGCTYNV